MSESVLDSSVLLAIIREEPIEAQVLDLLEGAVIGAGNYFEV